MRIQFTRDYRGVHTNEIFHVAGEIAEVAHGDAIVAEGAAIAVPEPEIEPDAPAETPATLPARKAKA